MNSKIRFISKLPIGNGFKDNFILDKIPDPSIGQVEACVRNHVLVDGVQDVFHDYIFSAPSLFAEFAKFDIRQDVLINGIKRFSY